MSQNERGFSLVEVLVALMLFATVGLSIQQLVSQLLSQRQLVADIEAADRRVWNEAIRGLVEPGYGLAKSAESSEVNKKVTEGPFAWRVKYSGEETLLGTMERITVSVKREDLPSLTRELVYYH